MKKEKMLSGWCYTVENLKRAKKVIAENNLNIEIEENFNEKEAYAIGTEEEIKELFEKCRG